MMIYMSLSARRCLEDLVQGTYLIEDKLSIFLGDLEHDLISGVPSLRLYEDGGALLVYSALVTGSRRQLDFPVELRDARGRVPQGLLKCTDNFGTFILPEECELLLVVVLPLDIVGQEVLQLVFREVILDDDFDDLKAALHQLVELVQGRLLLVEQVAIQELQVHGLVEVEVLAAPEECFLVLDVCEAFDKRVEVLAVHAPRRIQSNVALHYIYIFYYYNH
jgi:hypothetical protein